MILRERLILIPFSNLTQPMTHQTILSRSRNRINFRIQLFLRKFIVNLNPLHPLLNLTFIKSVPHSKSPRSLLFTKFSKLFFQQIKSHQINWQRIRNLLRVKLDLILKIFNPFFFSLCLILIPLFFPFHQLLILLVRDSSLNYRHDF